MNRLVISMVALGLMALACNFNFQLQGEPTGSSLPLATMTPTSTSPFAWPSGTGECTLSTASSQVAYDRPSSEASTFGDTGAGFETTVYVRTNDGWVGFDPGVAQAANIGIFRFRWLHFDQVALSGDCVSVPEAGWVPEPDVCYDMPMEAVQVYSEADRLGCPGHLGDRGFCRRDRPDGQRLGAS